MAKPIELKAEKRTGVGKGAARAIRRAGLIPGVIYGDKKDPLPITLDYKSLWKEVQTGTFLSTLYSVEVDGQATRVIPRDVQFDRVRDFPIHVDFLRLGKGAKIAVEVPIQLLNEDTAPGLKKGGALNMVRYEIELTCPADGIPEAIEVDVGALDIGDAIHISEVTLPDRVTPTVTDRDFTILTIVGQMAEEVEAEEGEGGEAEAAEGEAEESGGDEA